MSKVGLRKRSAAPLGKRPWSGGRGKAAGVCVRTLIVYIQAERGQTRVVALGMENKMGAVRLYCVSDTWA